MDPFDWSARNFGPSSYERQTARERREERRARRRGYVIYRRSDPTEAELKAARRAERRARHDAGDLADTYAEIDRLHRQTAATNLMLGLLIALAFVVDSKGGRW